MSEYTEGTYVLLRDVKNPEADARHRHDWTKAPVWKEGMKFGMTSHGSPYAENVTIWVLYAAGFHGGLYDNEPGFSVLFEALSRIEERPSDWLRRKASTGSALGVLNKLYDRGLISMADVQGASDEIDNESDALT